ncbi:MULTISPECIES: M56 family metallopeptidase [Arthrobacter]|uniref:M56 family metallopeptidase n=2 Tax=Arthrobacter TaxID=1663 RepID=A0ABU9KGC8_9MICC|nr:M56 family metallopeptidase [Arthrobacter sp. YJM1]MDP5225837.1 M56 family metallopeptidase [Arthrobacter sp. YJM1]
MFLAAWFLAALAIILAWPAPILLARCTWPTRDPFAALVLWQAIGLAGGLSMIGAMLCYGLSPLGDNLVSGLHGLLLIMIGTAPAGKDALGFWNVVGLTTAGALTLHLLFTLLLSYLRISTGRRRHRDLLAILSEPHDDPGTVVISHAAPVAYCLPGGARSVTVLSDSLMAALDERELTAVLAHESSHLTQRHHLLLWAFAAWRAALPWLPTTRVAQRAVNELIEMLADDAALKVSDRGTLIRAVAVVADGQQPGQYVPDVSEPLEVNDDAGASATTVARVKRLLSAAPALPPAQRLAVLASAVLLLLVPTALLIVPGVVHV